MSVDQYAVVGHPVSHSKSPWIHAAFARQTGQSLHYSAIDIEPDQFNQHVDQLRRQGFRGLNVTVPYKEDACTYVETLDAQAERAGAVNTIAFEAGGRSVGYNTDGIGLVQDLLVNQSAQIHQRRVLLLGAGGAARGVVEPLLRENPELLVIANRTVSKAEQLVQLFADFGSVRASGLDLDEPFHLIINATSASLTNQSLDLSENLVAPDAWAYDMMYGKDDTPFARWARQSGAVQVVDGLGMLVEQAAEAFYIWRGVRPDTAPVLAQLRQGE